MRSLRLTGFGEPLTWMERAAPEPRGTEVLLRTVTCGVCHSDIHLWEGYYDLGGGRRTFVKDRGIELPLTLGHEVVGRVVAAGPEAVGVAAGDLRLVYPWIGCGVCRGCGRGDHHLCAEPRSLGVFADGGYSDHVLVPDPRFLLEIGDLPPERACSYACAGLTAYSSLRKVVPLESDDTLVVIGAGGLGLMALHLVRELTPARIIVVDVSEAKLEVARGLVDCQAVNAADGNAFRAIRGITGRGGATAVIDFVGSGETASIGFGTVGRGGTFVVVGLYGGELTIPTPALPLRSVTVRGSYTGSLPELEELIGIARTGRLRTLPVTRYPLGEAQSVLERLRSGKIVGRAVLEPDAAARPPAEEVRPLPV